VRYLGPTDRPGHDATGRATGLILHQGGRDMPAKKIK